MTVPRKARRTQAGTTEASAPPLPVPSTVIIHLLGPNDPDNQPDVPAAWTPGPSAVLDWLTLVDDDLRTLEAHLRDLRRALEEVLP
jgi:hypothetical protein